MGDWWRQRKLVTIKHFCVIFRLIFFPHYCLAPFVKVRFPVDFSTVRDNEKKFQLEFYNYVYSKYGENITVENITISEGEKFISLVISDNISCHYFPLIIAPMIIGKFMNFGSKDWLVLLLFKMQYVLTYHLSFHIIIHIISCQIFRFIIALFGKFMHVLPTSMTFYND